MRENKPVISAPGVSHKAAKSKAILTQKGQLEFYIAKKTGRKETKMPRKLREVSKCVGRVWVGLSLVGTDSRKSEKSSWGPAGNLDITFGCVQDHECWNRGI